MEPPGLFFIRPIVALLTRELYSDGDVKQILLDLPTEEVKVSYTAYANEFKSNMKPGERSITEAMNARLTPGKNNSNEHLFL